MTQNGGCAARRPVLIALLFHGQMLANAPSTFSLRYFSFDPVQLPLGKGENRNSPTRVGSLGTGWMSILIFISLVRRE